MLQNEPHTRLVIRKISLFTSFKQTPCLEEYLKRAVLLTYFRKRGSTVRPLQLQHIQG